MKRPLSIAASLAELRGQRDDKATLTTVRRAFHTLKGSSRMVGFRHIGEGAWGVEQCFNLWLAQERAATDDLIGLADGAQRVIRLWVDTIERDALAHRGLDVLRVRGGHGLQAQRIGAADADAADEDLARRRA